VISADVRLTITGRNDRIISVKTVSAMYEDEEYSRSMQKQFDAIMFD